MTGQAQPDPRALLEAGLDDLGIPHTYAPRLLEFVDLIVRWNRVHNLTAIRDPLAMIPLHILDSLALTPLLPPDAVALDVGTGPGLPGIPLAIIRPDLTLTLLDSNSKKTAFVLQATSALGLRNITVVTARAEQWHPGRRFDVIMSRALAELREFVSWTQHLLDSAGCWIAMKGTRPDSEVAHLPADIVVTGVHRLVVPHLQGERHAVILRPRPTPPESAP